ncbi:MAG: antitoxin component YwqK of YwqJK toxin-antitoxin module [Crocinitomicaceae bacterium]|jgi:antitoxin component YwqK of YwqJK toxin-antitoxin module
MILKTFLTFVFFGLLALPTALAGNDVGDQGGLNETIDGKKQGKWIYLGKDRPTAGYPAEGKIEEGSYKDNRKEGVWIKYHNDGATPSLKGEYLNNRPSGQYTKFHQNGAVKETGTFNRNKYYDSLKRFDANGVLVYEGDYNDAGMEQGTVKYYYSNGQEEFVFNSQNGIATGKATRFYENGDVKEVIFYDGSGSIEKSEQRDRVNPPVTTVTPGASREPAPVVNKPRTKGARFQANGYNKVYNTDDEIWQDGEFKSGRLWDGKVYEYDSDGILLKVKVFKKGVYHSDGQL